MRSYDFVTLDVFTTERFGGNPLAVVLGADGLSDGEMQALAAEFNYSETTFVLRPDDPSMTARIRIFNRTHEMPFAGHPNVGTAYVLASEGVATGDRLVFEEVAGTVEVELARALDGTIRGATIQAPQSLSLGPELPVSAIASCLGIEAEEIDVSGHAPLIGSVGIGYVLVCVTGEALTSASPSPAAFQAVVDSAPELAGRLSIFLYVRDGSEVRARMFAPLAGTWEDPATGSASAALVAAQLFLSHDEELSLAITQGVELSRPSRIEARAWRTGTGIRASVTGACVPVFRGSVSL
jgi:trans-2,3-dihydro-3-hydroxyanthranilate isomerase